MSQTLLDNKYNSSEVEDRWYKHWLEKNYFHADAESEKGTIYHSYSPSECYRHVNHGACA